MDDQPRRLDPRASRRAGAATAWWSLSGPPNVCAAQRVVDRQLDRGARHPDRERADAGAEQVERAHRDAEAVAGLAEQLLARAT